MFAQFPHLPIGLVGAEAKRPATRLPPDHLGVVYRRAI
jgi:hypothetical protein